MLDSGRWWPWKSSTRSLPGCVHAARWRCPSMAGIVPASGVGTRPRAACTRISGENTDDPAKSPAIRIGPDEFTAAITFPETLSQHIAMAVDCNPWRVLTALHDADRQSGEDDDARADEAGNIVTLTEGYDIWPVSGQSQDARGPARGPLNQT
jgi:hypothetical protein